MLRLMAKAKIQNAQVTDTELHYEGSIGLDSEIMAAADLLPDEWVVVVNRNNGARLETYLIPEPAGSGKICLYGPAARLAAVDDVVHVLSYCLKDEAEARANQIRVVLLGAGNRIEAHR